MRGGSMVCAESSVISHHLAWWAKRPPSLSPTLHVPHQSVARQSDQEECPLAEAAAESHRRAARGARGYRPPMARGSPPRVLRLHPMAHVMSGAPAAPRTRAKALNLWRLYLSAHI